MPDIQSLHMALGSMTQKERDDFLGNALSHQPLESLGAILQKLDLGELPANSRVQLVFRMGLSPVAHAFRGGQDRQLRWVIPQVPDHLRTLVYSTSRLITEFQETLTCLQHGRGDFVKVFTLLNPENMMEMVNRFSTEMQNYTQQLRDANGRFTRTGPQRGRQAPGLRPAVSGQTAPDAVKDQNVKEAAVSTPADVETTRKARKANAKARTKDQTPATEPAGDAAYGSEAAPAETDAGEAAPVAEHQETAPVADDIPAAATAPESDTGADSIATSPEEALAAFGFDVLALAAEKAGGTDPEGETSGDSEK